MSVVLVRIACVPFSLAGDFVFEANGVVFTLSVGDRLCFNVTVNNDDENELDETLYFYLYQPNNLFTDKTQIVIRDNEEGGFDTDVSSRVVLLPLSYCLRPNNIIIAFVCVLQLLGCLWRGPPIQW